MGDKTDKLSKQNQQQKNDIRNYNLDHVYCSDNSSYRNATNITTTTCGSGGGGGGGGGGLGVAITTNSSSDLKTLRKENKQLQAMLLLHLDLIQEQSNQLIAKDKQLLQLREENEQLRLRCERSERRSRGGGAGGGGNKTPNANSPTIDTYFTVEHSAVHNDKTRQTTQIAPKQIINSTTTSTTHDTDADKTACGSVSNSNTNSSIGCGDVNTSGSHANKDKNKNDVNNRSTPVTIARVNAKLTTIAYRGATADAGNAIATSTNGKVINKNVLNSTAKQTDGVCVRSKSSLYSGSSPTIENVAKTSNDKSIDVPIKVEVIETEPVIEVNNSSDEQSDRGVDASETIVKSSIKIEKEFDEPSAERPKPQSTSAFLLPNDKTKLLSGSPKIILHPIKTEPAYGKRVKYCAKTNDKTAATSNTQTPSTTTTPTVTSAATTPAIPETSNSICNGTAMPTRRHSTRQSYISTTREYMTREWQLDEIEQEVNQLITDEPMKETSETLEIPKWKTWEFSNARDPTLPHHRDYEDINESAYVRRHEKFLIDERKRKKWDVQRIREQRNIERLKRRHCKDELSQPTNDNEFVSFFPPAENLKIIHITDDLPVSAFGELIPALPPAEFVLPWQRPGNANVIVGDATSTATAAAAASATATTSTAAASSSPTPSTSSATQKSATNVPQLKFSSDTTSSTFIFLSKRRAGRAKQNQLQTTGHKYAL